MTFEFNPTGAADVTAWIRSNIKLLSDLREIASNAVPEGEITVYLHDMVQALKTVDNDACRKMLFLMYDDPSTMPADARVDFVYHPTYMAATIMITAMNRFASVLNSSVFREAAAKLLEATMARSFLGAGYDDYTGFLDTLEIFAIGDTLDFVTSIPQSMCVLQANSEKHSPSWSIKSVPVLSGTNGPANPIASAVKKSSPSSEVRS